MIQGYVKHFQRQLKLQTGDDSKIELFDSMHDTAASKKSGGGDYGIINIHVSNGTSENQN